MSIINFGVGGHRSASVQDTKLALPSFPLQVSCHEAQKYSTRISRHRATSTPSLRGILECPVDPLEESINPQQWLANVQHSITSLQDIAEYRNYLGGAWRGIKTSSPTTGSHLLADAVGLNKLVQGQLL